jgi:TPP-dependent pyruvate/acetoin dehydrogenase alpha subunit
MEAPPQGFHEGAEHGGRGKAANHHQRGEQSVRLLHANTRQYACENLVDRAAGLRGRGMVVDATDLAACLEGLSQPPSPQARAGGGPQMIVGTLLRLAATANTTMPPTFLTSRKRQSLGQDCLLVAEDFRP